MENKEGFSFTYSAAQQQEVEDIRKKYLPKEEDKMEQLRKIILQTKQRPFFDTRKYGSILFSMGMPSTGPDQI